MISRIGTATGTTSASLSGISFQRGDLILVFAHRNTTTAPSLATNFTNIFNGSGNSNAYRAGYKFADGTETGSGTWTNATGVIMVVYRGVSGIGASSAATKASSTTANIPTLTLTGANSRSWVVAVAGHLNTTTQGTPLAGATNVVNTRNNGSNQAMGLFDTNAGVSSFAATTSSNGAAAVSSGGSIELLAYPAISDLSDPFNQNSLNTSLWNEFTGGSATIAYAQTGVTVTFPASSTSSTDGDISTDSPYDITGGSVYVRILEVPSASTQADAVFALQANGFNEQYRWVYEAGTLYAQYFVAGSGTTPFSVTYDSTVHKYWRIRESGGTIFWDTSVDGSSWTNRASVSLPLAIGATKLTVLLAGACFQNETNPGTFKWVNLNIITPIKTAITKSLQYTVTAEQSPITKSLQYAVKTTPSAITKSLQYTIKTTPAAITKSLQYEIDAPDVVTTDITKDMQYAVKTDTAITKSLQYAVKAAVDVTKSLKYTVGPIEQAPIQLSMGYYVKTVTPITKSLQYTIKSDVAITKSLKYTITTTPTEMTLSLQYAVRPEVAITKSLKYTVPSTPAAITKELKYTVTTERTQVILDMQYMVQTETAVQRSLKYTVLTTVADELTLQYAVKVAHAVTKSLQYVIDSEAQILKSLQYAVKTTPAAIELGLEYIISLRTLIQLSMKYTVGPIEQPAIQKTQQYAVKVTQPSMQRVLQYMVVVDATITKSQQYAIVVDHVLTKSLQYVVQSDVSITKQLRYLIKTTTSQQKSLQYFVKPDVVIQRTLKYTVLKSRGVSLSMLYRVGIPPPPYVIRATINDTTSHFVVDDKHANMSVEASSAFIINDVGNNGTIEVEA